MTFGYGNPVHFLHGNGFSAGVYLPFLRLFEKHFQITASDLRGHGDSLGFNNPAYKTWNEPAADIKYLIQKKMTPPVIGIGHSLGAMVTYMAAAIYPGLFSKIILIDPVLLAGRYLMILAVLRKLGRIDGIPIIKRTKRRKRTFPNKKEALKRFSMDKGVFKKFRPSFIQAFVDHAMEEEPDGTMTLKCSPEVESMGYASVPSESWAYASRITIPTLIIRGGISDVFKKKEAEKFQKKIPDATLITIPDTGHFVPMEEPEITAETILGFI